MLNLLSNRNNKYNERSKTKMFAFLPNGGKRDRGNGFKFSSEGKLKEQMGKIGSSFSDEKNFENIVDLASKIGKSTSNLKNVDLFISIVSLIKNGLIDHNRNEGAMIHKNENMTVGNVKITKTKAKYGRPYGGKIKAYLKGPIHELFKKRIADTQQDYLTTNKKRELYSYCGVNQKNYTFLNSSTFLTVEDVLNLTEFEENHKKEIERIVLKNKLSLEPIIDNEEANKIIKKRLNRRSDDVNMIRYYAGIVSQETKIKITNVLGFYDAHIIVHLVHFKDATVIGTIENLLQKTLEDSTIDWNKRLDRNEQIKGRRENKETLIRELLESLERIPAKQIKKTKESKSSDFSKQIETTLGVNLITNETFRKHCKVVKSWKRRIPENGIWILELEELFGNGIYLNKLYEYESKKDRENIPVSHFIIVESYGDKRATIRRISDQQVFTNVYSPVKLGYDFVHEIKHISKNDQPDNIMSYQRQTRSSEFLDESLELEFYPDREERLNVDIERIDTTFGGIKRKDNMNKSKEKIEFVLEQSVAIEKIDSVYENLAAKFMKVDPEGGKNITEDDGAFWNNKSNEGNDPLSKLVSNFLDSDDREDMNDNDNNLRGGREE